MTASAAPDRLAAIDELDRAIVTLAARINTATHDLLVLIRRFDERAGWLQWGFGNCADWLHWRCDLSLSAAREKVRVAHALKTLPAIAVAFAEGRLSYSKVRALSRVACRDSEEALLHFALHTTAARVEERCRELRCGTAASVDEANRAHTRRALILCRNRERGTMTITVELPLETGELIDQALDRARDTTLSSSPEFADESWAAQQADALVVMAKSYLSGEAEAPAGSGERYQVTVHVDQAALTAGEGRSGLPIETVKRLACDSALVTVVEDQDGEPLSVGRKSRTVPSAIKRALRARDRGCRFPGCTHKRYTDAHHVEHWASGGETSLKNLILLCTQHHRLVHEGGFRIDKDYADRWFFRRPDGRAVPACGYRATDLLDDVADAAGEFNTCTSAEGFLSTLKKPPADLVFR
ncbi:MAG: DUF222 domain-containing protein [Steroidobacteraceae bacterium]